MNLYISYRRTDAAVRAARLAESLTQRLGKGAVTWDADLLEAGADFRAQVTRAVDQADAMLVVIGPRWLQQNDATGRPRIHAADDVVQLEIAQALRLGKRVVPVLVDGASMPAPGDLPASLQSLACANPLVVYDTSWEAGVNRIVAALRSDKAASADEQFDRTGELVLRDILTGPAPSAPAPAASAPRARSRSMVLWIGAALALLAFLVCAWVLLREGPPFLSKPPVKGEVPSTVQKPIPPPSTSVTPPAMPPTKSKTIPPAIEPTAPTPTTSGPAYWMFGLVMLLLAMATALFAWSRLRAPRQVTVAGSAGAHVPKVATYAANDTFDVFVSHANEDQALAQDIVSRLEPRWRCWIAPRDIPPGVTSWAGPIVEGIARSRVFLVIISSSSIQSKEVLREVTLANEENVHLMPVRIDDTPLSTHLRYFFATVQRMDAAGWARERILADVSAGIGKLMQAPAE